MLKKGQLQERKKCDGGKLKGPKKEPKIDQNRMPKRVQICHDFQEQKNCSSRASWRRLGASKTSSGELLETSSRLTEPSQRILESLGDVLGALGAVLEASWEVLGRSWRHLGGSLGRLGAVLGALEVMLEPSGGQKAPNASSGGDSS